MSRSSITLVRTQNDEGVRNVWVGLDGEGNLVLEAQDLGKGVEAFFGAGNTEYEWELSVPKEHFPRLLELIGAAPDTPILQALQERFSGAAAHMLRQLLEYHKLAGEGWTRVGG